MRFATAVGLVLLFGAPALGEQPNRAVVVKAGRVVYWGSISQLAEMRELAGVIGAQVVTAYWKSAPAESDLLDPVDRHKMEAWKEAKRKQREAEEAAAEVRRQEEAVGRADHSSSSSSVRVADVTDEKRITGAKPSSDVCGMPSVDTKVHRKNGLWYMTVTNTGRTPVSGTVVFVRRYEELRSTLSQDFAWTEPGSAVQFPLTHYPSEYDVEGGYRVVAADAETYRLNDAECGTEMRLRKASAQAELCGRVAGNAECYLDYWNEDVRQTLKNAGRQVPTASRVPDGDVASWISRACASRWHDWTGLCCRASATREECAERYSDCVSMDPKAIASKLAEIRSKSSAVPACD